MATIVVHRKTEKKYVLVGTGFGMFESKKPNWLLGDWLADTSSGQINMACVARPDGTLAWVRSAEIYVKSVDGVPVKELLESA